MNLFEAELRDPPRAFSLLPFWFWNDKLDEAELLRQIDAFERNGVFGFVIHPRVGLPRDLGWMSKRLLSFYDLAVEEAARRGMSVLLYDEGMYPSGSSCGQVVARDSSLACRCLALNDTDAPLADGVRLVGTVRTDDGRTARVVDRRVDSVIRGLHYVQEDVDGGKAEDEPPAGDILNPRTAEAVIDLVYQPFFDRFGKHFGKTILGVFTDEPNPLGRCRERNVKAGTTGMIEHVSRLLGYDFAPHLGALWSKEPGAKKYQADYAWAVRRRLEETWYGPLSRWCESKGVALCGHPDSGDEIGVQRFFQIPGQDLVWRWVAPGEATALEGPEATQGKCSSSAMLHTGRRRNSNEFAGAYGAGTPFSEIEWLANWCLVRGVNLLFPHAFYYSVRGPRRDERPPQVGLHTPQWDNGFKTFADHCRRLCWINTDSRPVCHVAILTDDHCPWPAAAAVLKGQRDFNYLDLRTLNEQSHVDADGVRVGDMLYRLLVIDGDLELNDAVRAKLSPMIAAGRVIGYGPGGEAGVRRVADDNDLIQRIDAAAPPAFGLRVDSESVRLRIIDKAGRRVAMIWNESPTATASVDFRLEPLQSLSRVDTRTGDTRPIGERFDATLGPGEMVVLMNAEVENDVSTERESVDCNRRK